MPDCAAFEQDGDLPARAAELLAAWRRLNADGGGPTRGDFTPFSLRPWLGNIDIYHVENTGQDGGPDFRLRLNGSATVALTSEDWTGRTAREIDRALGVDLHHDLLSVLRSATPRVEVIRLFQKNYLTAHRLLLPIFSESGERRVVQIFLAIFGAGQD